MAAAEALSAPEAVNRAGRQRMLSQRMAKAWLMQGLDLAPRQGRVILGESRERFERQLAELRTFVPNDDVRRALAELERAWRDYGATLAAPARRENAVAVYDGSESVLERAHRLTLAYEKAARTPRDRLVNIAGRQRMLSQRMAKFYLFQAWDVNAAAAEMELGMARAEFASGMSQLAAASSSDEQVRLALERLDAEWIRYRELLMAKRGTAALRAAAPEVAERSERVLAACEALVALYERRARAEASSPRS